MTDRLERIKQIWDLSQYGFPKDVQAAGEEMREWLRNSQGKISTYLFENPEGLPKDDSLREVAKGILKQFPPLKKSCQLTYVLSVVIDRGNELGVYNICPPPISIYVKRDSSPFLLHKIHYLPLVSTWQKCLWESVVAIPAPMSSGIAQIKRDQGDTAPLCEENGHDAKNLRAEQGNNKTTEKIAPWNIEPWQVAIGRVLASAALHGGLCNTSLLLGLYEKLTSPLEVIDDISFLTFELTWPNQPGSELRRWFPDDFTEMLFLQLPQTVLAQLQETHADRKAKKSDVDACLKQFFKVHLPDKSKTPKSTHAFVQAIIFKLETRLPMFLVSFASRKFTNHSLKPEVWKRVHGKMDRIIEDQPDDRPPSNAEFENDSTEFDALLPPWFVTIKDSLTGKELAPAKQKVKQLLDEAQLISDSSPRTIFTGWAWHMTHKGSASGNPLALSTIRGYFSQLGQRVIGQSGRVDLTTLPIDGFQEIYTQILEDAESRSQRVKLSKGLREFHHYLAQAYKVEPINYAEVLGLGAVFNPVDANLITPDEFTAILNSPIIKDLNVLKTEFDHPDVKAIARLVLILAFRCGMRRSEILGLEVRDLLEAEPCELLLRPHAHRTLKTKSSNRKLPLHALLPKEELEEILRWKKKRLAEIKDKPGPQYLFAVADWGEHAISPDRIIEILHTAIRETTGDNSLKFHHLRHSFATWTLFRMMVPTLPRRKSCKQNHYRQEFFGRLAETRKLLGSATEFLSALMLPQGTTRKYLFADASLLGHAGPEMSLEHYVHCCDMLLKLFLERQGINPGRPTLILASGLTYSTAQRHFQKGGSTALLSAVRRAAGSRIAECPEPDHHGHGQSKEPKMQAMSVAEKIKNLWTCLYQLSEGVDRKQVVRRFGYSIEQHGLMAEALQFLIQSKCIDRQFAMKAKIGADGKPREHFPPPWPQRMSEKDFFQTYAAPVWALFASNQELAMWGVIYYLKHAWKEKHLVLFKDPADRQSAGNALRFLHFLEQIDIPRTSIKFVRMDNDQESIYLVAWQRLLGLTSRDNFVFKSTPKNAGETPKRWLGIALKFTEVAGKTKSTRGAEVFRFALMMAFIDFSLALQRVPDAS